MSRRADNKFEGKNIFSIRQYGRMDVHLADILDSRNMTRNALARATDTRFEVVKKWYDNTVTTIDLDVLARFCYVLDCTPDELIKYSKPEE